MKQLQTNFGYPLEKASKDIWTKRQTVFKYDLNYLQTFNDRFMLQN